MAARDYLRIKDIVRMLWKNGTRNQSVDSYISSTMQIFQCLH